jgi:glycosyltransferase involved in cell wall biosynthesis
MLFLMVPTKIFKPITDAEKQATRQKYTSGNDYFIFVGALSPRKNVANLLLAFDRFKTLTKSTTKLIIVGEKMFKTRKMKQVYSQLLFKDDVIFTGQNESRRVEIFVRISARTDFCSLFRRIWNTHD